MVSLAPSRMMLQCDGSDKIRYLRAKIFIAHLGTTGFEFNGPSRQREVLLDCFVRNLMIVIRSPESCRTIGVSIFIVNFKLRSIIGLPTENCRRLSNARESGCVTVCSSAMLRSVSCRGGHILLNVIIRRWLRAVGNVRFVVTGIRFKF